MAVIHTDTGVPDTPGLHQHPDDFDVILILTMILQTLFRPALPQYGRIFMMDADYLYR